MRRIERDDVLLTTHSIAQHGQQSEWVLLDECLDLRRRHRQETACMRDFDVEPRGSKASERRGRAVGAQQIQLSIRQVAPVFPWLEELGVNGLDLRCLPQPFDVSIHEFAMIPDEVSRFEDDIEMIQTAEILEKELERVDRRRALRQQP